MRPKAVFLNVGHRQFEISNQQAEIVFHFGNLGIFVSPASC